MASSLALQVFDILLQSNDALEKSYFFKVKLKLLVKRLKAPEHFYIFFYLTL